MILSDRSLREAIEAGRLVIDPLADDAIQPSSIDVRLGEGFRVFANHRYPHIDVRQPMEGLTELIEASEDEPFILHPGEFVLAATLERVALPEDLVARLEGKSSLGRLGLLIHSSLPASEPVLFLHHGELARRPISEIVDKQLEGCVVGFDLQTFEVGYHEVTGWYEGPPDRIYEVELASGRSVRVTAGHNLFTLAPDGQLVKTRTVELEPGTKVAIPRRIPAPDAPSPSIRIAELAPESEYGDLVVRGPTVDGAWQRHGEDALRGLREAGFRHGYWYREKRQLPLSVLAQLPGLLGELTSADRVAAKGGQHELPAVIEIDEDVAWLLGLYVAEGSRRRTQATWSNTDSAVLDRVEVLVSAFGVTPYRNDGVVTACSKVLSSVLSWMGTGPGARDKRIPRGVLGWPDPFLEAFLAGFAVGDGSFEETRLSLWTSSDLLVGDLLLTLTRLGKRAGSTYRERDGNPLHQIYAPHREHKLLTATPPLHELLVSIREATGWTQHEASLHMGYRQASGLNNLEKGRNGAIRLATLRRVRDGYQLATVDARSKQRLERVIDGDLLWDRVVAVRDTGSMEAIYDLEVRPGGAHVENFLSGRGGVFVSNTAGFIDAGWDGHLTLELSNVANLPITLYPGMKIGQLALFRLDQPAEHPYGSKEVRSKYQGQRGPTESRYHLNFDDEG